MKRWLPLSFALAAGLAALPSHAVTPLPDEVRQNHEAAVSRLHAQLAQAQARTKAAKVAGTNAEPGTPLANEYRAYPPSCAAWPLPDTPSSQTPTVSGRMALYTTDTNGIAVTPETVTVTFWRLPCSSSGNKTPYNTDGGSNAMTLMRIDRDSANEGHQDYYPRFPWLLAKQGSIDYNNPASIVRSTTEPNTFVTEIPFDSPVFNSTTYVLENYNYGADYNHLYGYAFSLLVDPYATGADPVEFTLGDYTAAGRSPLPLNGYAAAQWQTPDLSQGLLVQVTEQPQADGTTVRQLVFDLLLKDGNGDPIWLVGNAAFPVGATSATVDTYYLGAQFVQQPWGRATFQVNSCNQLEVTYVENSGVAVTLPTLSGTVSYRRIFDANGMVCE